jgi:CDP-paratose synthetase
MKTILLTGATGFLGSHLLERMIEDDHHVIILKRSFSNTWRISGRLDSVQYYDLDSTTLYSIFNENRIDCIVHTAVNYGRKTTNLGEVLQDNLVFPIALAECAFKYGCKCFINTDSFFTKGSLKYDYLSYYTLSKKLLLDALRVLPIQTINCKLEHVYGLSDDKSKFIPSIISQIIQSKNGIDLTDGTQKRDFVFVEDVVKAYSLIIEHADQLPTFVEFEIGTGTPTSIFEVVSLIKSEIPESRAQLNWGSLPRRRGEPEVSYADTSSISNLGWTAKTDIVQGIRQTVKYYMTNGI